MTVTKTKMKSPLRWPGGKNLTKDRIIEEMPPHELYGEAFAGGAHVLIRKSPSHVEALNDVSSSMNVTIPQLALAWVLTRETITAPIIGVNSVEQLSENLAALEIRISDSDLDHLNEVSDWTDMDFIAR